MIKSMTGFGRSEYCDGKRNIIVEIKSVNHRYNDISIRMPKKYSFTEEKIKAAIKNVVKRGKVDVSIIIENLSDSDSSVELNTDLARQYYNSLNVLKNEFQLDQEISVSLLASMPDMDTDTQGDLFAIPGTPPNMLYPPKGDAFAARNKYAMKIDFKEEPPMYKVSETHYAATWLLHPDAPKVEMPENLKRRIEKQKRGEA